MAAASCAKFGFFNAIGTGGWIPPSALDAARAMMCWSARVHPVLGDRQEQPNAATSQLAIIASEHPDETGLTEKPVNYTLRMLRTGTVEVPCPEVYWMERFQEWTTLEFQMVVIRGGGKTAVVNTGFPDDITAIAKGWRDYLGDRAILSRPDAWKTRPALQAAGIDPSSVDFVLLTPLQLYTTGNLRLFSHAKICISRRGWIEDIIAPTYPHHVPRSGCIADEDLCWLLRENQSNLHLLEDVEQVLPGLVCRWAGVHHRSSLLVEVQTARGLVILSDCAFHFANLEELKPLGIAESIIEAHAVYRDIRARTQHFLPLYEPKIHERYPGGVIE